MRVDAAALRTAEEQLAAALPHFLDCQTLEELRGLEGAAANVYFGVLDELILNQKDAFSFRAAAAGRRWTISMPCCPLGMRFCRETALPLWRVWASIHMWDFSTVTGPGANLWRWI